MNGLKRPFWGHIEMPEQQFGRNLNYSDMFEKTLGADFDSTLLLPMLLKQANPSNRGDKIFHRTPYSGTLRPSLGDAQAKLSYSPITHFINRGDKI